MSKDFSSGYKISLAVPCRTLFMFMSSSSRIHSTKIISLKPAFIKQISTTVNMAQGVDIIGLRKQIKGKSSNFVRAL